MSASKSTTSLERCGVTFQDKHGRPAICIKSHAHPGGHVGEPQPAATPVVQRDPVPITLWGRDHHSTLLYLETRCVDHGGRPEARHMRCDGARHPQWTHLRDGIGGKSHTRLADGSELRDHDDWDCVADMVAHGLVEEIGTGLHPRWKLTPSGWTAAHNLRRERAERGLKAL